MKRRRLFLAVASAFCLLVAIAMLLWMIQSREAGEPVPPPIPSAAVVDNAVVDDAAAVSLMVETETAPVEEGEEAEAQVAEVAGDLATHVDAGEGVGALSVRVVEEGTRIPLTHVIVIVRPSGDDMSMVQARHTNDEGRVLFEELDAAEYRLQLQRMGVVTPAGQIRATVRAGERTELVAEFPAREAFLFRLIDTDGKPIAGQSLRVGFKPLGHFVGEEVTTGADGTFFGLGYRRQQHQQHGTRWVVASDDPILMKKWVPDVQQVEPNVFPERVFWSNPTELLRDDGDMEADEGLPQDIVATRDVVQAEAILVNAPDPGAGRVRFASVMGDTAQTYGIPIEDDRFAFLAPASSEAMVVISNVAIAPGAPEHRYHNEGLVEFVQEVAFPDVAGPWSFEVRFPESLVVDGRVVDPAGNGVAGVEVIARSPLDPGQTEAVRQHVVHSYVHVNEFGWSSPASDDDGAFRMELPTGNVFDFAPNPQTVPEEFRAHRPLRRTSEELASDPAVTLQLQYSSVIWGEVVDADGRAIPGATVDLFSFENQRQPIASTTTDEDGVFELDEPIAFDPPGDDSPVVAPDHYLRARTDEPLSGFSAVTLNTAQPTTLVVRDTMTVLLAIPEGHTPPIEWPFLVTYAVPGLDKFVGARTALRVSHDGRIERVLRGYSRIEIVNVPRDAPGPRIIDVPDDAPDEWSVVVDFGKNQE